MAFVVKLLLLCAVVFLVIESTEAKDLKEVANEMREKRELQAVALLEEKAASELALQQNSASDVSDLVVRNKRSGCGGGGCGGGCGCCCCCCCCGCGGGCGGGGCGGRKKRQILTILRARRNSLADEVINGAANDWNGYSGSDFEKGYGTGRGAEQPQNNNGEDENCAECDE